VPATLESNLRATLEAIAVETERARRDPDEVRLLAVTKSVAPPVALELARLGQRDLGENRLPNLLEKRAFLDAAGVQVTWHFIGKIQRNKARKVVLNADVLHSVDGMRLLETLERVAAEEERTVRVYLEVKLSDDPEKHGFAPDELATAALAADAAPHLELLGLMTMATRPPAGAPEEDAQALAREEFDRLAQLAKELESNPATAVAFPAGHVQLSIGMSGDYAAAIAAGSDVVRIGTALYAGLDRDSGRPAADDARSEGGAA